MKQHVSNLGDSFLIIADEFIMSITKNIVEDSFNGSNLVLTFEKFNGECSRQEINRLIDVCSSNNCNVVVGIGGGKTLDTAKAVAYYKKLPVVIVPTIASTDAPCSALSVIYTEEGVFSEYLILPKNPDLVLVDTSIIAKAPARLLVAGMGDALATYFEARACAEANATNMAGAQSTKSALALAKLCYETLLEDGYKAKLAVEYNIPTKALENIIEANTYLSGIGFESGGLAAAHSIHNGFTVLKECHHLYHGEKVAFGTIVQLVLENRPIEEIEEVIEFCISVGLPITLEDMGIKEINHDDIMKVAKASCAEGETIHNMPFKVTPETVYSAILTADAIGKQFKL
ncbi:glycerol dehydrogenase [Caloranaerobacter azorensis]|uniref:glycerol dehydrogenase n=1 Tax=Caloranaerobacter azorensis TaxID=116090 RepID=UPI0024DE341C|nr:glycerol dehydrogenase [Caloranaerobacter azorensis]